MLKEEESGWGVEVEEEEWRKVSFRLLSSPLLTFNSHDRSALFS